MRANQERQKSKQAVNVTFSIPKSTNMLLHTFVEKRGLSKFVTRAIQKALEEEKNSLKAAFRDAENDPDLKETISDWAALDGEDWDA